ncbi:hypothetical protein BFR73_03330 [Acinetobacter pittii]|uniref:hypothetical protein n=1 Tax=Acinetobacter pittii TaxID=48296 RepID=UPI000837DE54|nr:hypothetical protein [Acinetobacter pittii]OCZ48647.1 hypothetical protein BFR73_03330 [Acinetobacter pittii]
MKKIIIACLLSGFLTPLSFAKNEEQINKPTEQAFTKWMSCVDVSTKFYSLSGESTENIATAVMGKCRANQETFNAVAEQSMLSETSKSTADRKYARQQSNDLTLELASQLKERVVQKLVEEKAIKGLKNE